VPLVGKNIDAFCSRCGFTLAHIVLYEIAHPRFGRGFIESVTTDDMEVLFREGRKRMTMNRPEAGP